jgi:hypothetical protein
MARRLSRCFKTCGVDKWQRRLGSPTKRQTGANCSNEIQDAHACPGEQGCETMRLTVGPLSVDSAARGAFVRQAWARPAVIKLRRRTRQSNGLEVPRALVTAGVRRSEKKRQGNKVRNKPVHPPGPGTP